MRTKIKLLTATILSGFIVAGCSKSPLSVDIPKTENREQIAPGSPIEITPETSCKFEDSVKVYDEEHTYSATFVVKSNSELAFNRAIKSIRNLSKIVQRPNNQAPNNKFIEPQEQEYTPIPDLENTVIVIGHHGEIPKGKAVRMGIDLSEGQGANSTDNKRVESVSTQTLYGYSIVVFYYTSSAHQITNLAPFPVNFLDYAKSGGSYSLLLENVGLGPYANHWDSQGQLLDRQLVASAPPAIPIYLAVDYW